jgi:hypothetical protein
MYTSHSIHFLYVREAKLLYATTTKRTETQHFLLFFSFFLIQILQFSSEVPYSALETPSFETSIADKNEACTERERERERENDGPAQSAKKTYAADEGD